MTDHTPRDRALAGEVVKVTDERLAEMQRIAVDNEGIELYSMHWHWASALTELIAARKEIERLTQENAELLSAGAGILRAYKKRTLERDPAADADAVRVMHETQQRIDAKRGAKTSGAAGCSNADVLLEELAK